MLHTVLKDYRNEIDKIDQKIANLFQERMKISKDIASIKKNEKIPILNVDREEQVISNVKCRVNYDLTDYIDEWYRLLMKLSRQYQGSNE